MLLSLSMATSRWTDCYTSICISSSLSSSSSLSINVDIDKLILVSGKWWCDESESERERTKNLHWLDINLNFRRSRTHSRSHSNATHITYRTAKTYDSNHLAWAIIITINFKLRNSCVVRCLMEMRLSTNRWMCVVCKCVCAVWPSVRASFGCEARNILDNRCF